MNEQRQIGAALEARGYTSKNPSTHLVKAVVKLIEEVAELAQLLPLNSELNSLLYLVERVAKREFDYLAQEGGRFSPAVDQWLLDDIEAETADCQVVLMDIANALNRLDGEEEEPFDLLVAAVAKAERDIDRGVRQ